MSVIQVDCLIRILIVPVAQGTEQLPSKQRVAGSNPAWDATIGCSDSVKQWYISTRTKYI